jgi:hypothetical protein
MIASTRESVTRALLWFKDERIISMEKNQIRIRDMAKLLEIAKHG